MTPVDDSPVTVAVNCWVSLRRTEAPCGAMAMPGVELPPEPPEPPDPDPPEPPEPDEPEPLPAMPLQLARKMVARKSEKSRNPRVKTVVAVRMRDASGVMLGYWPRVVRGIMCEQERAFLLAGRTQVDRWGHWPMGLGKYLQEEREWWGWGESNSRHAV